MQVADPRVSTFYGPVCSWETWSRVKSYYSVLSRLENGMMEERVQVVDEFWSFVSLQTHCVRQDWFPARYLLRGRDTSSSSQFSFYRQVRMTNMKVNRDASDTSKRMARLSQTL
jgi:hypothetical protein